MLSLYENGRNFEYLLEDPYLTDKIAAALVRGMNIHGNSLTVKHFAANSQEYSRRDVNAVVSERALREIYLKSFEMADWFADGLHKLNILNSKISLR